MESDDAVPHVFPTGRRPGELLFGLIFLALAALLLSQIGSQTQWLPGKGLAAQPRLWPLVGLGGMVFFGALHLHSLTRARRNPGRWREAWLWLRSLEYVGWYLIYVFSVPRIGYLGATVIFCLFLTWRAGYRSGLAFAAAGGFALFVVLLFKSLLHVRIPGGAIYEYLPGGLRNFMILYF
ncbi:MAG: tripartite tricarboxylate transporter TctB family protein [Rhizobium sp.]|nr:tripartite tricarboxylate transporter TctB family protein [Rhizobium sp.]